ncbi:glycosyltransferase [Candidatus Roizmanbacteria bacterium]|nr:MAG: glycosyltransferase [Candidatus Roizmanbacteria bacterium]
MKTMGKEANLNTIHGTSSLMHEGAISARSDVIDFAKSGMGGITGGTAPAVETESRVNAQLDWKTYNLDSPHPVNGFDGYPELPYDILAYDRPVREDGEIMTQDEMIEAYQRDEQWMAQHVADRQKPGKHIIFAHHTVSTNLEPVIQREAGTRDDTRIVARFHSPLLATTLLTDPESYNTMYPGKYGEELWEAQAETLQDMDLVVFSTETERKKSVEAVRQFGLMTGEDAENRFVTLPIPLNLSQFEPDTNGSKRREHVANINMHLQRAHQNGVTHLPRTAVGEDEQLFGYIGRFDHEKGIWDFIDAYAEFLHDARFGSIKPPTFVAFGGLANKPGIIDRHQLTLEKIRSLPPELQHYILLPLTPAPHHEVVHGFGMQVYPSFSETFNISEKQARAAGNLVAVSDIIAHRDTNGPDTALMFDPRQSRHYEQIFRAAMFPQEFEDVRRMGQVHAHRTFRDTEVCEQLVGILNEKFEDFMAKPRHNGYY